MICTKCGKDGGEFPFCPYCGEKMQNQSAVWRVGMPCPHCGGLELEGDRCAFCGVRLSCDYPDTMKDCAGVPFGRYKGAMGCFLELNETGVVLKNYYKKITVIPYHKLVDVFYFPGTFSKSGWICVRWEGNAFLPVPEKYGKNLQDTTTVLFRPQDRDLYYGIYCALAKICEKSKDGER